MPSIDRPYDNAFSPEMLAAVKRRREHPTGEMQQVTQDWRGNELINVYPWAKMELGDFFLAPIGDRSKEAMRITFHKAAARYDYEIQVIRTVFNHEPVFRVTLTVIGVRQYKHRSRDKYYERGISTNIRTHDRLNARRKRSVAVKQRRIEAENNRPLLPMPGRTASPPIPDINPRVPQEVLDREAMHFSREEAIARALASK